MTEDPPLLLPAAPAAPAARDLGAARRICFNLRALGMALVPVALLVLDGAAVERVELYFESKIEVLLLSLVLEVYLDVVVSVSREGREVATSEYLDLDELLDDRELTLSSLLSEVVERGDAAGDAAGELSFTLLVSNVIRLLRVVTLSSDLSASYRELLDEYLDV
jgi:hypothetical protein